jgi:hypothetical protein
MPEGSVGQQPERDGRGEQAHATTDVVTTQDSQVGTNEGTTPCDKGATHAEPRYGAPSLDVGVSILVSHALAQPFWSL